MNHFPQVSDTADGGLKNDALTRPAGGAVELVAADASHAPMDVSGPFSDMTSLLTKASPLSCPCCATPSPNDKLDGAASEMWPCAIRSIKKNP